MYSQLRYCVDEIAPFTVAGARHLDDAKYFPTLTKARAILIV